MRALCRNIRQRREALHLSGAELARRAGISKGFLHTIESGETAAPSVWTVLALARCLETTIGELVQENNLTVEAKIDDVRRQIAEAKANIADERKRLAALEDELWELQHPTPAKP